MTPLDALDRWTKARDAAAISPAVLALARAFGGRPEGTEPIPTIPPLYRIDLRARPTIGAIALRARLGELAGYVYVVLGVDVDVRPAALTAFTAGVRDGALVVCRVGSDPPTCAAYARRWWYGPRSHACARAVAAGAIYLGPECAA